MSEEKKEAESGPAEHKRKSWPAWRVVLTDFIIVVLGVGVALAAQQAVENLHDRARADEARASIKAEIADNLGRMNLRQAREACIARKLGEIDRLIADYPRGLVPSELVWIGMPFAWLMHDSKYKAAVQSGAVSLLGDSEQATYADLYAVFTAYADAARKEGQAWDDLRTLEKRPPYSATLDWQLRSAMQHARSARFGVTLGRMVGLREGADIGVAPAPLKDDSPITACLPLNTPRAEVEKSFAASGLFHP